MTFQLILGITAGVAVFGFAAFMIGVYVGIQVEKQEQFTARANLSGNFNAAQQGRAVR